MLRIALIQMLSEKAAIDANLRSMAAYLAEATRRGVDILGFPEMCITGYADPTRYPQAVIRLDGPEVACFLDLTRGSPVTVLAGLIEANPSGDKPFITHVVARDGELLGWYRKVTIKDGEERWFSAGDSVPVFRRGDLTFGISICADISNEDVTNECVCQGARIVFELAAPGLYGEQADRDWQSGYNWWRGMCQTYLGRYAKKYGIWIAVATQAGRTVDEDFPGGGYVFAPDGRCLYATPDGRPGAAYLDLDLDGLKITAQDLDR